MVIMMIFREVLQGWKPSQPKGLSDSPEQNLQDRHPPLPFQADRTHAPRCKFGVRGTEESAVCYVQKEDHGQRRSTGRNIIDIF